jgi:predicted anti-sigma-YlaC factor YlaD
MISCREILEFLSAYLEKDLDSETLTHVDCHLRDCPPCVEYVDSFRRMIVATGRLPTIETMTIPPELRARLHSFLAQRIAGKTSSGS